MQKSKKIHTGFRLTKKNVDMIKEFENSLGINKTSVVDMILTMVGNDKKHFIKLIKEALNPN